MHLGDLEDLTFTSRVRGLWLRGQDIRSSLVDKVPSGGVIQRLGICAECTGMFDDVRWTYRNLKSESVSGRLPC